MSAAADKAQFYIEQQVPELRELEAKQIFTAAEIRTIVQRRRDFEHRICAPGCTPLDCARYIEYEMNLDKMRLLRAKRVGARVNKHSGPRRLFPLLERMNRKFPGNVGLWMQYIDFAKKQKAIKRVRKAFADVLRLHPEKVDLWIYAARYEFEQEGNLNDAEAYIQRGLRISPKSKKLYVEFFRLLLDSLQQIESKSRKIGLNKSKEEELITAEDQNQFNEDQILLPSAEESGLGLNGNNEEVDPSYVEALQTTRVPHEQIARAIFDSAMKQFKGSEDLEIASEMFDIAALYEIPGRLSLLKHIYEYMRDRDMSSALARNAAIRMPLIGLGVNTADFATSMATVLMELLKSISESSPAARVLHVLSARWIALYHKTPGIDAGIVVALEATLLRIINSYRRLVEDEGSEVWEKDLPRPHEESLELIEIAMELSDSSEALKLREAASKRWPSRMPSSEIAKPK